MVFDDLVVAGAAVAVAGPLAGSLRAFHELERDLLIRYQHTVLPLDGRLTVLTIVALGTLLVGFLACLRPTARGLSIQPTEAMREH